MDAAITLAENIVNTRYEDIPSEVLEISKKQLLDIIACIIGGSTAPGCKELVELIMDWGGKKESTILGYFEMGPAPLCAFANAAMGDALDYDDTHDASGVHSSTTVIPACLSVAESKGSINGREFLASITLGVDLVHRMGLATELNAYEAFGPWNGWEVTPLYGFFGAAAATARILGLDKEKTINALGIAYAQASGNAQCVMDGALTKRLQPGFAAKGGVISALMAEKGISGARGCMEGPGGLYSVYHRGQYNAMALTADLGYRYEGKNVCFKAYPCCRASHTSIDATLQLVEKHHLKSEEVVEVIVSTGKGNEVCVEPLDIKRKPRNVVDALFSIPWGVSVALVRGRVGITDFTAEAVKDYTLLEMSRKVIPKLDDSLSIGLVDPAVVEIKTVDGRTICERVDFPYGSPKNPIDWETISRKLIDCASWCATPISRDKLEKLVETIMSLEKVDDIRSIMRLLG